MGRGRQLRDVLCRKIETIKIMKKGGYDYVDRNYLYNFLNNLYTVKINLSHSNICKSHNLSNNYTSIKQYK